MSKNYILGGGIAGLIWAYYNSTFTIITEAVGGQFNNHFSMGPRFLEDNEFSRKLLTDLEIPAIPQTIHIGYQEDDGISDTDNIRFFKKYYEKSRGEDYSLCKDKTVMNCRRLKMDILNVDFPKLIELLIEKVGEKRIIYSKIYKIETDTKKIHVKKDKVDLDYDRIVSSIPVGAFYKIANKKADEYYAKDMTYVLLKPNFADLKDFDFVYCCGKTPYHRLTKTKDGIVAELLGWKSEEDIKLLFPDYVAYRCIPNAQIISGPIKENFNKDIQFIGRYGRWDREWKTEKVIEEAIKYE